MEAGAAFYARQGNTYILKLTGDIRYTMGCALCDFLERLFSCRDYDDICVDLTEAQAIDSTSLGLLAKIANFSLQHFSHKTTLFSTNDDINQVLDSMGFYEIFNVCDTGEAITETLHQLAINSPCKHELTRIVYEAHQALSGMNPRNREAFQGVLDNLGPQNSNKAEHSG